MKKNKFFGTYYKHQTSDGFTISLIVSNSNEGEMMQIITNEKSYMVEDLSSINVSFQGIEFNIHQKDLELEGFIIYGPLLKPKKDIMSYFRHLPIECKHNIYSMYHRLHGKITLNGKEIMFCNGDGYIEGDEGRNFPSKYLWFNATSDVASITAMVADIPLGITTITGVTCLIEYNDKEYRFGTYNFARADTISKNHIVIRKGKYTLIIEIEDEVEGHLLRAPISGNMDRFIKEAVTVKARYILKEKNKTILDVTHPYASYEYMY